MTQTAAPLRPSNAQIDALVRLLARRFPDWDFRQMAATESGLPGAQYAGDPTTGWRTLVGEAVEVGRVPALLRAASGLGRGDAQLAALADGAELGTLTLPTHLRPLLLAGGALFAVVGAAALALGGAWYAASGSPSPERSPIGDTPVVAAVASAPALDIAPEPAASAAPPATVPAVAGTDRVVGAGLAACGGTKGQVVGYIYYNQRAPVAPDEAWTTFRDLAIRDDYPRRENGWKYDRAAVVCTIYAGTVVRLDPKHPAMEVEGGAWWVPVVAGRMTEPGTAE